MGRRISPLLKLIQSNAIKSATKRPLFVASNLRSSEVEKAKSAAKSITQKETIFSKIIDGTIPAKIIYRDEKCLAFHDVSPQAPVHFLVIPIKPIPTLDDASEDETVIGPLIVH